MMAWIIAVPVGTVLIVALLLFIYRDRPGEVLEKKYARPPSQFVEIKGTRVHYRDEGRGPAMVLLHGIFASLHTWDGWVAALAGKNRLIRIDLPGWGLTGKAAFDISLPAYVAFLHDFLEALGIEKMTLTGNSFGGMVAWNYAIQYPAQVEKLILIDAAGYPGKMPTAVGLISLPGISFFAGRISPRFIFDMSVRQTYGNPQKVTREILDRYHEIAFYPASRRQHVEILLMILAAMESDWPNIQKVTAPTLIMWGAKDSWISPQSSHRFKSDIRQSELIIYEDAGHIPMEEIPKETARDADRFISGTLSA